jgi:hypothetical protein
MIPPYTLGWKLGGGEVHLGYGIEVNHCSCSESNPNRPAGQPIALPKEILMYRIPSLQYTAYILSESETNLVQAGCSEVLTDTFYVLVRILLQNISYDS